MPPPVPPPPSNDPSAPAEAAAPRRRFLAAAVQMRSGPRKAENVARALGFVEQAAARGARLVVLPEVFSWRGPSAQDPVEGEPLDGATLTAVGAAAGRLGVVVVAGSILERPAEPGAMPGNTSVVFDESGRRLAVYRKIHLFDVTIPGRVDVRESARRTAGAEVVCVDTSLARLGLSVCYDLRFPELYRELARQGAEVLVVPSAFTAPTGAAHWDVLLRARAIENQCWLIAPNQVGPSGQGHQDWGHSSIVDPWGTVVARARDDEGLVLGEIDLDYLDRVRTELPALTHRRLGV